MSNQKGKEVEELKKKYLSITVDLSSTKSEL
jgi:hypothetical protein